MKRLFVFLFVLLMTSCSSKKADVVLIVKEEGVQVQGNKVTFERNASGALAPKLWVPGYIVVFKVDGTLGDSPGNAGVVYRIDDKLQLEQIDLVDPQLGDEEITKKFLK